MSNKGKLGLECNNCDNILEIGLSDMCSECHMWFCLTCRKNKNIWYLYEYETTFMDENNFKSIIDENGCNKNGVKIENFIVKKYMGYCVKCLKKLGF